MGRMSNSQNQLFWNNDGSAAASSSNKKNNYLYYVWGRKEHMGKHKDSFQSKANDGNEISLWPAALP